MGSESEIQLLRRLLARQSRSPATDIAILCLNYPPEQTGIASYTGGLAVALARAGRDVAVHSAHPHYPEWQIHEGYGQWNTTQMVDGVRVQRRRHYVPRPPRGVRRLVSEFSFGLRLLFAKWGSPRVVIAVSPPLFATAVVALRLRLTPFRKPRFIVWVQDVYSLGLAETGEGGDAALRVTRWVEGRTLRAADRVVVLHPRFGDFLTDNLGVPASRIVVHRNWTHLEPSDPIDADEAKTTLGWPSDATLAVHTGNMGAKQGLENIVDAARIADEIDAPVHFILVGDGGERRHLEEYGRGISRLTFVDPLDDEKYRLALSAADILIVNEKPGVSAMAMPCKLTSYFDAGRPVIAATDPSGITASEVQQANAGLVVRAGEPGELLNAVIALGQDPLAAANFGRNGRLHREAVLDERVAVNKWHSLIDSVAATGNSKIGSDR